MATMVHTFNSYSGSRNCSALVAVVLLFCLGCGRQVSEQPQIAFVVKTLSNPFWVTMRDSAVAVGSRLGWDVRVVAPPRTTDIERQLEVIESAVSQEVDGIVVAPTDSKAIVGGLAAATEAGIPIVIVDTRLDSAEMHRQGVRIVGYVGSDNYRGGRLAAQALLAAIDSSGRIAVLEGVPGQETARARNEGFKSVVETVAAVAIVASQPANWERDRGLRVFENIMQANPGLSAVFAANDEMALGAIQALRARGGQPGEVVVVGFDAIPEAVEAVEEGWMYATIAQQPGVMAVQALELLGLVLQDQLPLNADSVVPTPLTVVRSAR